MLQTSQSDYTSILSEFLQKQVIIFGPEIITAHLSDIKGLHVSHDGVVKKIEEDPQTTMEEIVKRLSTLSEYAVKKSLDSVVVSHTDTAPKPADLSDLPSPQEQLLQSIPLNNSSKS